MTLLAKTGHFARFSWEVTYRFFTFRWNLNETLHHLSQTLFRCFLPVIAVVLPFGMVISLQGLEVFHMFGAERLLASLASVAIIRELSPVLASVLVAAQGGSANTAELGSMATEEELDATSVMGLDPIKIHVVPRVIAMTIACPILNVAGTTAGICGSFFTAVYVKGENAGIFIDQLWEYTTPFDITAAFIKTAIFGLIIGLVSTYLGYYVKGGAAGVGRAVNATVVNSILLFIAANYLLTSAMFGVIS